MAIRKATNWGSVMARSLLARLYRPQFVTVKPALDYNQDEG